MAWIGLKKIGNFFHLIFGSTRNTVFVLLFAIMGVSYISVRMKNVELDYQIGELKKKSYQTFMANKELKAERANALSSVSLRGMAEKYDLHAPSNKQILVVP